MSNVFDQAFHLSRAISEQISDMGYEKIAKCPDKGIVLGLVPPLLYLSSYANLHPHSADLVIFDSPRASKRQPVELYDFSDDGNTVEIKLVKIDDPNYKFLLTANVLAAAKVASRSTTEDGLILVTATPDIYLCIRGAFEHYLGSDKFLGEIVYQTRSGGGNDSLHLSIDHETILIFAKKPNQIQRFQLEKSEKELSKYSLEDEISPYYWDTYIRKNARNYYPIEAPDGSMLEFDDDGNRISWLLKKESFLSKLASGDIKFEKNSDGKWKLYYKDRQKDLKILRSISLNATLLSDISSKSDSGLKGADLLNKKGTEEIKSFNGIKPDYLKPSTFFRFLIDVFCPSNGTILIPYPEYGSGAVAYETSKNGRKLYINTKQEFVELIDWRLDADTSLTICDNTLFSLQSFFSSETLNCDLCQSVISALYSPIEDWAEFSSKKMTLFYAESDDHVLILAPSLSTDGSLDFNEALKTLSNRIAKPLMIFSTYDIAYIGKLISAENQPRIKQYERIPQVFFQ